jgi:hypothetical protein
VRLIKERINDILISLFNNKNEAGAGGAENDCAPRNAINDFRSASYENKTKNQKNKTALGMASAAHFSGEGHGYVRPGRMCTGYNYIIASATGPGRSLGGRGRVDGVTARLKVRRDSRPFGRPTESSRTVRMLRKKSLRRIRSSACAERFRLRRVFRLSLIFFFFFCRVHNTCTFFAVLSWKDLHIL